MNNPAMDANGDNAVTDVERPTAPYTIGFTMISIKNIGSQKFTM